VRERDRRLVPAPNLCYQQVYAAATPRYRNGNLEHPFSPLAACFQHVHPRKHVNACVFAVIGCTPLIPEWFPQRNFRLLYSSHSGVNL
jgi:hypothetical protein